MSTLRIKGLVRFADRVRRELSGPLSPARKERLREEVAEVLRQVDDMLAERGTRIEQLPSPTRRAHDFLARLDVDAVPTSVATPSADAASMHAGSVRLVGLKSFWATSLDQLACRNKPEDRATLHHAIRSTSEAVEQYIALQGFSPASLTDQSRSIRGWLAMFAQPSHFAAYVAAIDRATAAMEDALGGAKHYRPPARVQFRPCRGFYMVREAASSTQVALPVPMISFSREQFEQLAQAIFRGGDWNPIAAAVSNEEYQTFAVELAILSGAAEATAGVQHDLSASFERVNQTYFAGALPRPRLTWNRTFTGRKFGHYDTVHDTVMVSCTLDRADVQPFVVDYIMYHELLHKQLGIRWVNGRKAAHTAEFRELDRRYPRYAEADAALKRLARDPAPSARAGEPLSR